MTRSREVPRWKRNRYAPAAPVVMTGRQARKLARQGMTVWAPGQVPVTSPVPGMSPRPGVPGSHVMRSTGGFRFRMHLVPFAWLGVLCGGLLAPLPVAAVAGAGLGAAVFVLSRPASRFARRIAVPVSVLTAGWLPLLSAEGWTAPWPVVLTGTWLAVAGPWLHHYRWRPSAPVTPEPGDVQLWARHMAAKRARDTWLANRKPLPGGGRQWTVMLPAGDLAPASIMSLHPLIAGVWDKPMTEVFPEPYPDGRQSRCLLTILERDTLAGVREWDGTGVDERGIASVGRFADGAPARIRLLVPRDGTRHGLIAGTTGAGKSYLLDLLIRIALASPYPIVPVVLDPQEGQSLPQWRDKVLYAAGVDECMAMLCGLHGGMYGRSRYLGSLEWDDDGHRVRGMDFYDPQLSGLPVVMPIIDEAPVLLTDSVHGKGAVALLADMAKLSRKTGLSIWPVAQVPSLAELGDQVVRSMLRGGNVICLRTGDSVSAGYLGLHADPSTLPHYFADGSPTSGLGYLLGLDRRQAPARADLVPARLRHADVTVPALDPAFADAIARARAAFAQPQESAQPARPALRAVPSADDDAPEGRRAVDAVWTVLRDADRELERGEIIKRCAELVTTGWGRKNPFALRSIGSALDDLAAGLPDGRRAVKVRHGIYRAVPNAGIPAAGGEG